MKEKQNNKGNFLETASVKDLLLKFAVPSIIAMLVSALYNIVDQIFIGQSVGTLGNAATNVAFPLSTSCIAIALLLGIGGASTFNLTMGKGDKKSAPYFIGNSVTGLFICGLLLFVLTEIFLTPMLRLFGSTDSVLSYAKTYVSISAIGFPFVILATGGGHLVRADGSPQFMMLSNLLGAIVNTVLDALFIFGFNMGMAGAALATIIGQICSGLLVIWYLTRYKTVKLSLNHLVPKWHYMKNIITFGTAPFFNQVAMMIVQIIMNQSLTYYGATSIYGQDIPLACAGIITKISMVFFSIIIGISQGMQPIVSFNYGANNTSRVKEVYKLALRSGFVISIIAFILFQVFPRQIISFFGKGDSELYYDFAIKYFRIFLFFTFANCVQPIVANFFTSIGKPKKGVFLSLTRQIIFFLPLLVVLPMFIGINGIMYAGPIADLVAAVVGLVMGSKEINTLEDLKTEIVA